MVDSSGGRLTAPSSALVLGRSDVTALLSLDECIAAVEAAFKSHAEGRTLPPGVLGVRSGGGGFHIKAAGLRGERTWFAAKCNANFPENPERHGLPAIQGVIVLCDGETGVPLALMDSMEITLKRTGAATAVAARRLARRDSRVATICGCGEQGRVQLRALTRVLPLARVHAFDRDPARAHAFARTMAEELGLEIAVAPDLAEAVLDSDVCVTCTPARGAFLLREHVAPGTFVAAVGADAAHKQELDPRLMAAATVVVDVLDQCATIGELHHALDAGVMGRADVHAELHELVAGTKPGRRSEDEIVVFDSTGTALEDVAAARVVYEKAVTSGAGLRVLLGA